MKEEKHYFVYILANKRNGTLYVGVTSNLIARIGQHKEEKYDGFTKQYGIDRLVYYESFGIPGQAIYREKQLKRWRREWKVELIKKDNPTWSDLFDDLSGCHPALDAPACQLAGDPGVGGKVLDHV